jgi:copper chaperone NosL
MNTKIRILIAVAALLLILSYFFPLWQIHLIAPQYPGGLNMYIWQHQVTGDLGIINTINHYIGMKKIVQDEFAEFAIIPYVTGVMILFGLAVAIIGKRKFLIIWLILFGILAIIGVGDFYIWLYDYGHNLSPDAPITLEGFTPPLIGNKVLANFIVYSFPNIGMYIYAVTIFLAVTALYFSYRYDKTEQKK